MQVGRDIDLRGTNPAISWKESYGNLQPLGSRLHSLVPGTLGLKLGGNSRGQGHRQAGISGWLRTQAEEMVHTGRGAAGVGAAEAEVAARRSRCVHGGAECVCLRATVGGGVRAV